MTFGVFKVSFFCCETFHKHFTNSPQGAKNSTSASKKRRKVQSARPMRSKPNNNKVTLSDQLYAQFKLLMKD